MSKRPTTSIEPDDTAALDIPLEKVCFVIVKAREFDVKEGATDPDSGSNASDDRMISVLEDTTDDPVEQELRQFIGDLSDDEQIDLVALMWLGREDNTAEDWAAIRAEAARARSDRPGSTANYVLGEPLASDYLAEGLNVLGYSCQAFEA